ncbi:unnamed protein product [Sphagnum balticum]
MTMDSKKIIEKLIKIAENQQKIINKLAQNQPSEVHTTFTPGATTTPKPTPPAAGMHPNVATKNLPAGAILAKLPPAVISLLTGSQIEVHDKTITALVKPGQSDQVLDHIQQIVQNVAQQVLPPGQYKVNVIG